MHKRISFWHTPTGTFTQQMGVTSSHKSRLQEERVVCSAEF